ncbi:ABC transporter permease [Halorarum salinum]|uniref:ABC transporter permease n=1 Tax=Halorarum salinum TaxID=2743089 RepID=A0A7D5QJQ6_9EURY|nr:ABC transporter permease [Halobaculum salinum]QLG63864.1 ABC transporter permease [Halobaculum salinum]
MTARALSRVRGLVGVAVAVLRHDRGRTALAVAGIAVAVLATTSLASVGVGVVETGTEKFDAADRDLWVTGGPVGLAPGTVGGFENTVTDAHALSRDLERREEVRSAVPMSFQTVYVGTDGSDLETVVGVGVPGGGPSVGVSEGRGFERDDVHYADGGYDGPMTNAVVVDPRTAERFDLEPGDTLHVGGTVAAARSNEFTVVGVSSTFSGYVGTPTVALHLAELQTLTGTAATDRATLVTVRLEEGADPARVEQSLQEEYPEYEFRTNRDQLRATLGREAVVLASGASLVVLAVVAGIALSLNLLLSFCHQQREELRALKALGCSSRTLVGIGVAQALVLGALGGALGLALTYPATVGLEFAVSAAVGYEGLVRTPTSVLAVGAGLSLGTSSLGAAVAAWQVGRL